MSKDCWEIGQHKQFACILPRWITRKGFHYEYKTLSKAMQYRLVHSAGIVYSKNTKPCNIKLLCWISYSNIRKQLLQAKALLNTKHILLYHTKVSYMLNRLQIQEILLKKRRLTASCPGKGPSKSWKQMHLYVSHCEHQGAL